MPNKLASEIIFHQTESCCQKLCYDGMCNTKNTRVQWTGVKKLMDSSIDVVQDSLGASQISTNLQGGLSVGHNKRAVLISLPEPLMDFDVTENISKCVRAIWPIVPTKGF